MISSGKIFCIIPIEKIELILNILLKINSFFQPYSENPAQFKPLTDEE